MATEHDAIIIDTARNRQQQLDLSLDKLKTSNSFVCIITEGDEINIVVSGIGPQEAISQLTYARQMLIQQLFEMMFMETQGEG